MCQIPITGNQLLTSKVSSILIINILINNNAKFLITNKLNIIGSFYKTINNLYNCCNKKMSESQTKAGNQKKFENLNSKFKN